MALLPPWLRPPAARASKGPPPATPDPRPTAPSRPVWPPLLQLGLRFPGGSSRSGEDGGAEATLAEQRAQHAVDLSLYDEAALLRHDKDSFPLVIRLETVTDKGLKEGHTLQVRCAGLGWQGWFGAAALRARREHVGPGSGGPRPGAEEQGTACCSVLGASGRLA